MSLTPKRAAVAGGGADLVAGLGRDDDPDLLDPGLRHRLDPVEQDRLVGDRHELLGARVRDRPQPRALAAGQDQALQLSHDGRERSGTGPKTSSCQRACGDPSWPSAARTNWSATRLAACAATALRSPASRCRRRSGASSSAPSSRDRAVVPVQLGRAPRSSLRGARRSCSPSSICSVARGSRSRFRTFWDLAYVHAQISPSRTTYHSGIRCGQPRTPLVAQMTTRCSARNVRQLAVAQLDLIAAAHASA